MAPNDTDGPPNKRPQSLPLQLDALKQAHKELERATSQLSDAQTIQARVGAKDSKNVSKAYIRVQNAVTEVRKIWKELRLELHSLRSPVASPMFEVLDGLTLVGAELEQTQEAIRLVEQIIEVASHESSTKTRVSPRTDPSGERQVLSKRDQLIRNLVTPEIMEVLENPGIIRKYHSELRKNADLKNLTANGLRSALNRIRKADGLPKSKDL